MQCSVAMDTSAVDMDTSGYDARGSPTASTNRHRGCRAAIPNEHTAALTLALCSAGSLGSQPQADANADANLDADDGDKPIIQYVNVRGRSQDKSRTLCAACL